MWAVVIKPQALLYATKTPHLVTELTCANAPISLSQNYVLTSNLIQNYLTLTATVVYA
jgi:hypothetical protein